MIVYHYNRLSGEYMGQGNADPDPMRPGQWLVPAFTTAEPLPATGDHQTAVYRDDGWHVVADYRGTVWWRPDGTNYAIAELGIVPDQGDADMEQQQHVDARREAQEAAMLKASAQAALNRSDITILRCIENAVTVPEAWQAYRKVLRDIVSGTSTEITLPERPDYPEGT